MSVAFRAYSPFSTIISFRIVKSPLFRHLRSVVQKLDEEKITRLHLHWFWLG